MRSFKLVTLLVLSASVALLARWTSVSAYFSTEGSGLGTVVMYKLSPPLEVVASAAANTASISWNAAAINEATPAAEYTIERYDAGTGAAAGPATCGIVRATSGVPNAAGAFTCTDAPVAGSYEYVVTAHYGGWTARSPLSNAVTVHATSITVSSAESSVPYDTKVPLTATVEGEPSGSPVGDVEFRAGQKTIEGCAKRPLSGTPATATCEAAFSSIGKVSISARYTGSSSYPESTSPPIELSVVAAEQHIELSVPERAALGSSPVSFTATSSSGLPVKVESLSTSVCEVSESSLTLLKTGSCEIEATQSGSEDWSEATPVKRAIEVYQSGQLSSLGRIKAGEGPARVVVSPDGRNVYVTNRNTDVVSEYERDRETGQLTAMGTVPAGNSPEGIAIDANGENAYVANRYTNSVSVYRRASSGKLEPVESVESGSEPIGIAITPNGRNVYVADAGLGMVSEYERNGEGKLKEIGEIIAGENAHGIVVAPDGEAVYVTNYNEGTLSQYRRNTSTGALSALTPATVAAGANPHDLAISPDGKYVYVAANTPPGMVSVFRPLEDGDLEALSELSTEAGKFSECVAISPKGESLYVTNFESNNVSEYERMTATGALKPLEASPTIEAGAQPEGIAVSPEGNSVYVADYYENSLAEYQRAP